MQCVSRNSKGQLEDGDECDAGRVQEGSKDARRVLPAGQNLDVTQIAVIKMTFTANRDE